MGNLGGDNELPSAVAAAVEPGRGGGGPFLDFWPQLKKDLKDRESGRGGVAAGGIEEATAGALRAGVMGSDTITAGAGVIGCSGALAGVPEPLMLVILP